MTSRPLPLHRRRAFRPSGRKPAAGGAWASATDKARVIPVAALAIAAVLGGMPGAGQADTFETSAREALLIDFDTGAILLEKNADMPMPPASMSKIMTAYLAFERLASGELSLEDKFTISKKAWRKGGSRTFLDVNSQVKIADILRGIIVQSGNDAAIALAEGLAGSEEAFAEQMNAKAAELGMTSSSFRNATGWPDPEHKTTARDLVILAEATIRNFPQYYPLYAEIDFTYNDIKQGNRNPLLYGQAGADGLKTGYTRAAGYGLTASVARDGRRLILVINGLKRSRDRSREARALIEWGFSKFRNHTMFKAAEDVEQAAVWLGVDKMVPLVAKSDVVVTVKQSDRDKVRASVHYNEPIPAPVKMGQQVATLKIAAPNMQEKEFPLVAGKDVAKLGVFSRAVAAIGYFVWGPGG